MTCLKPLVHPSNAFSGLIQKLRLPEAVLNALDEPLSMSVAIGGGLFFCPNSMRALSETATLLQEQPHLTPPCSAAYRFRCRG